MPRPKPVIQNEARMVTDIIERRNESRKWMRKNLHDELTEVWRALKCKTAPIFKKDRAGVDTQSEDKSRTNVAMPDLNVIYRKNAARMTANPYRLKYIGSDELTAEMLSALAMQQYDRSDEAFHDVRCVLAAEAFGFGYTKLYWDQLVRMMSFRRAIMKSGNVVFRDRAAIMRSQGASYPEIEEAIGTFGPEMDDDEIARFMAKSGTEIAVPTELKQYEGPIVKWIFNGDLYVEPNTPTLEKSSYCIEQFSENDLWLEKMSQLTYEDPETGEETYVFDPNALQELIDTGGDSDVRDQEPADDLRDMFNAAIGREREQEYYLPKNLRPRKKFNMLEQHSQDRDDGKIYISWCSEKWRDRLLGRMPYQCDLYGKYAYTDLCPLPDLIVSFGDSTPRLLRHLYMMHNLTVAQNFDYVTNLLKPFLLRRMGVNVEPEVIVRGLFRELQVADLNGVKPLQEPPLPNGAFEREAQIMQMMSLAEPTLTSTDAGTSTNPQAGKTATTALLASKAADALTQFKFDARNRYLRELGAKKLWMNQQMRAQEQRWDIESRYWGRGLRKRIEQIEGPPPDWALTEANGEKVYAVQLDPMQIQQDFIVEPEAGSYLAVDDETRQQAAMTLTQVAMANPDIIDKRKVIAFQMSTIRGIGNPDDYFLPPSNPTPPPPKVNVNIQVPIDKVPGDVVNQLLPMIGLQPSPTLEHQDAMNTITSTAEAGQKAGEAADSLLSPGEFEQQQQSDAQQQGADAASQAADQAHEASMQGTDQLHDAWQNTQQQIHEIDQQQQDHQNALAQGAQEHQQAMTQADQAHAHAMTQADQAHASAMLQGAQKHESAMAQGAQAQTSQALQKGAQMASQERIAKGRNKPNGKPNGQGKPNGRSATSASTPAAAAPPAAVLHLNITHGPAPRNRKVKLIRGEDGTTTGAEISEE
jgi:hypothetical protein